MFLTHKSNRKTHTADARLFCKLEYVRSTQPLVDSFQLEAKKVPLETDFKFQFCLTNIGGGERYTNELNMYFSL